MEKIQANKLQAFEICADVKKQTFPEIQTVSVRLEKLLKQFTASDVKANEELMNCNTERKEDLGKIALFFASKTYANIPIAIVLFKVYLKKKLKEIKKAGDKFLYLEVLFDLMKLLLSLNDLQSFRKTWNNILDVLKFYKTELSSEQMGGIKSWLESALDQKEKNQAHSPFKLPETQPSGREGWIKVLEAKSYCRVRDVSLNIELRTEDIFDALFNDSEEQSDSSFSWILALEHFLFRTKTFIRGFKYWHKLRELEDWHKIEPFVAQILEDHTDRLEERMLKIAENFIQSKTLKNNYVYQPKPNSSPSKNSKKEEFSFDCFKANTVHLFNKASDNLYFESVETLNELEKTISKIFNFNKQFVLFSDLTDLFDALIKWSNKDIPEEVEKLNDEIKIRMTSKEYDQAVMLLKKLVHLQLTINRTVLHMDTIRALSQIADIYRELEIPNLVKTFSRINQLTSFKMVCKSYLKNKGDLPQKIWEEYKFFFEQLGDQRLKKIMGNNLMDKESQDYVKKCWSDYENNVKKIYHEYEIRCGIIKMLDKIHEQSNSESNSESQDLKNKFNNNDIIDRDTRKKKYRDYWQLKQFSYDCKTYKSFFNELFSGLSESLIELLGREKEENIIKELINISFEEGHRTIFIMPDDFYNISFEEGHRTSFLRPDDF